MDALKNFSKSLVAVAPSPAGSGLTLDVTTGTAGEFPPVPFNAVVFPANAEPDSTNATIIRVTNIVGDTFTFTRTQEGSNNRSILVGDRIRQTLTKKTFDDISAQFDVLSQAVSVLSQGASVETAARIAKDDAQSISIQVLSQAVSVLSQQLSVLSSQVSTVDVHASTASAAATSVLNVINNASVRSAGNVSTKGLQSAFNALSNVASVNRSANANASTIGSIAALSLAYLNDASVSAILAASIQTASAAATSVDARVASLSVVFASLSARSVGNISTKGFQSIFNALSNRISATAAGTGSVTSAEVIAVRDASTAGSIAALSQALSYVNAASVKSGATSVKGLQSVLNALSTRIAAGGGGSVTSQEVSLVGASIAAIVRADSTAGSIAALSQALSYVNAASVKSAAGSARGLQSVFNALSNVDSVNRSALQNASTIGSIAALSLAYVNDASLSAVLAASIQTASAAATSVDARVGSLSAVFASLSARSTGNVSTHGFQSIFNALSNRISAIVGGTGSVTSAEVIAVRDASTAGSIAALSQALSYVNAVSVKSAATSVKGLQSVVNALSAKIASFGTGSVTSTEVSAVGASIAAAVRADSTAGSIAALSQALSYVNNISARSVGNVSTKGLQSIINTLSNVDVQNRSALQNASTVGSIAALSLAILNDASVSAVLAGVIAASAQTASAAATSVDSRIASLSVIFASLSTRSVGNVSTHGFQSMFNALSNQESANRSALQGASTVGSIAALSLAYVNDASVSAVLATSIQTASAAATSVDARVASLSVVFASLSARSVGNVSTHGFQSIFNALSNRISATAAGTGSVTSAEVIAVRDASTAGSIAALSQALSYVNAASVKSAAGSAKGLQSVLNALSNTASVNKSAIVNASTVGSIAALSFAIGNDASLSAVLAASIQTASAAATSVDSRVGSLSVIFASLSARSVGNVSTHGFQSLFNALSNRISAVAAGTASATSQELSVGLAAVSAQAASALSDALSAASASYSAIVNASTNTSLAAISILQGFLSGISSRSVGNVSTHGLQSVINALSNRISAGGGTGSVTSTEGSIIAGGILSLQNNDAVSMVPGHVVYVGASADTMKLFSTTGGLFPIGLNIATLAVSVVGQVQTQGVITLTSAQMKSVYGASAMVPGQRVYATASGAWTSAFTDWPIGFALGARKLKIELMPARDLTSALSDALSAGAATASQIVNASTVGSLAAISLFNAVSARSVGNVSTKGLQSVINALSTRIASAAGGTGSVTSAEVIAVRDASTVGSIAALSLAILNDASVSAVLQSAINTVSNQVSVNKSAWQNASTAGSIAALSQALSYVNNVSIKSGAGSARGLQSVLQAISVRIAAAGGGGGSVTSTELSDALSAGAATASQIVNASTAGSLAAISLMSISVQAASAGLINLQNLAAVSLIPGQVVMVGSASANTVVRFSTLGTFYPLGVATTTTAVSAQVNIQTQGVVTLTSTQMKSVLGVSAFTLSAGTQTRIYPVADGMLTVTPTGTAGLYPIGQAIASRTFVIDPLVVQDLNYAANNLISARNSANVSVKGLQSIFNALSDRVGFPQTARIATGAQVLSGTGFANVSGLAISIQANATYEFEGKIMYTLSNLIGTAFGFTFPGANQVSTGGLWMETVTSVTLGSSPAGATLFTSGVYLMGYGAVANLSTAATAAVSVLGGTSGTQYMLQVHGMVNCTSAGNVQFQAKQSATGGGVQFLPGSFLRAFKIT